MAIAPAAPRILPAPAVQSLGDPPLPAYPRRSLYPGTSVHRVEPVTRGARLASFFWVESMVRSDEQRSLLHEMDRHLMRLRESVGETDAAVIGLTGTYHNLLRLWADV